MTEPQRVEVPTETTGLAEKEALRLVLFGLPAAGKSSLLGALLQTADTQPAQLGGSIEDRSRRLEELRQRVYFSNLPTRTVEEVVPYPVEYRPLPVGGEAAEAVPAILIDCDGQVAIDLLRRRKSLTELSAELALAKAVLEADALLLVIDASAPVKQMEADFEEFGRFLAQMELSRELRTDVGGLPVFLVLTKCDLLSSPDQLREQWKKQIEERQRYVGERFRSFIRRRKSDQDRRTFGLVDLYQAATATSQPPFANAGAKALEPYGVGSLFQQAFHQAGLYRQRQSAVRKRLYWTIGLGGTILGVLIGLILALLFFPSNPFIPDATTLEQRLAGQPADLEARLKRLIEERDGPDFSRLPALRREEITNQITELESYLTYYRKVLEVTWPGAIESEAEMRKVRDQLTGDLSPRKEWVRTQAARLEVSYLHDADAMLEAADTARKWYQRSGDRLRDLWAFRDEKPPINWRRFQERSDAALADAGNPPFREEDVLSKSPYGDLTWANALRVDTVKRAKVEADKARKDLTQVRRVAAALGLLALGRDYPEVLNIPRNLTLDQVVQSVAALKTSYPGYRTEFAIGDLPEVMREEVAKRADEFYHDLITPARAEVLRQLKASGRDTRTGWLAVAKWLQAPKELAELRTLAGALNRLRLPPPPDPIEELRTFLEAESFTLRLLPAVEVSIPLGLELKPKPGGALEVFQPRVGGASAVVTLKLEEEGITKDARAGLFRCVFRAVGDSTMTVVPGDDVFAKLPLTEDKMLSWKSGNRSAQYTFERLSLPPRLDGNFEDGISLRVLGLANRLPKVPDLLPEVPR